MYKCVLLNYSFILKKIIYNIPVKKNNYFKIISIFTK